LNPIENEKKEVGTLHNKIPLEVNKWPGFLTQMSFLTSSMDASFFFLLISRLLTDLPRLWIEIFLRIDFFLRIEIFLPLWGDTNGPASTIFAEEHAFHKGNIGTTISRASTHARRPFLISCIFWFFFGGRNPHSSTLIWVLDLLLTATGRSPHGRRLGGNLRGKYQLGVESRR
jgi:hypothetical protein